MNTKSKPEESSYPTAILSDKNRLNQITASAYNLAEQKILDGTAPSQLILYFLKLGDESREEELKKLRRENELLNEKIESLRQTRRNEAAYAEVIKSMREYNGI